MARSARDSPTRTLAAWTERDLTAEAAAGSLAPAFEVDEVLQQVNEVIASGRHPVLVGEPGVGKTAVIHELVRRAVGGDGPLAGKRVLQLSIQRRTAALKEAAQIRPEMQKLLEVLQSGGDEVVPYFRDFHLAYDLDLEGQFEALGWRRCPLLCEGARDEVRRMLEYEPRLEQAFVTIEVEEPSIERAARLIAAWALEEKRRTGRSFTTEALEEGLQLAQRFLGRQRLPRSVLELLGQAQSLTPPGQPVTAQAVVERFAATQRVPRVLVDPAEPLDLAQVEASLGDRVLGQEEAVRQVMQVVALIKSGLADLRRPFAALLFAGPTGVGKTHLAQLLAEYLFGSRERLVRLNMADYQQPPSAEQLFGSPYGQARAERRGVLTHRVAGHPFAVLLLDEFEKAHDAVHDRFLQLFDEGTFLNGAGELVSCRSMILIATTNAGAEVFRGPALGFGRAAEARSLAEEAERRMLQRFRRELLNRFDAVVHFRPLSRETIRKVAARELEALTARSGLRRARVALDVDESVLDWLTVHGYDPIYGARFLRRAMERAVTTAVAAILAEGRAAPGDRIRLEAGSRGVRARVERGEQAAPARRESVALPRGTLAPARSLDRKALLAEAEGVVAAAARRLAELRAWREESGALLQRMNQPGFWDDDASGQREVMSRYRELDLLVQSGERWSADLLRLEAALAREAEGRGPLPALARAVEAAARALGEWEERLAQEGADALWVVIGGADPLVPPGETLLTLAGMELAWCRRRRLSAEVVAWEGAQDELVRVVLEVEGPGAEALLAMEAGVHRFHRTEGGDARLRLDLVERSPTGEEDSPQQVLPAPRRGSGPFDRALACTGRLDLRERGVVIELGGEDARTLSHLLGDLERAWGTGPQEAPPVARLYGQGGTGARDPRTAVVAPRLKDVLRGDLDRFLEGWRRRQRGGTDPAAG